MRRAFFVLAALLVAAVAVATSGMFGVGRTMGPGDAGSGTPGGGFAIITQDGSPLSTQDNSILVTQDHP